MKSSTTSQKYSLVFDNHVSAWQRALDDDAKDGAVFLEDDMVLMTGWRGWLAAILKDPTIHIVRFDETPWTITTDDASTSHSLLVHDTIHPFVSGGYYMSYEAIRKAVTYARALSATTEKDIECTFWQFIKKHYKHGTRTTTPRLGFQNWYAQTSSVQTNTHMEKLSTRLTTLYLPHYGHWYNLSEYWATTNISHTLMQAAEVAFDSTVADLGALLIYITTHMSKAHKTSLHNCWPEALTRSPTLLGSADILFFTTTAPTQDIVSLFGPKRVRVELYTNPGLQQGAILALTTAVRKGWFNGYDWVIRLNPDVIIRDETWLVQTMQDPDVDGIFADCLSRKCTSHCTQNWIHTDFFVVRPRTLRNVDEYYNHNEKNAERGFTSYMQPTLEAGKDRWLPHTTQRGSCRVQGTQSPVIHDHDFIQTCQAPNTSHTLMQAAEVAFDSTVADLGA